ncbi:hypothetical protein F6455_06345 [Proteobacteria bacterium 005FR1]|nr:hypothetical protein [Proteobacteria bacterium 005FR1]
MTSLLLLAPFSAIAQDGLATETQLQEDYSEAIRDIEIGYGPYDAQLLEPLDSLGRLLTEKGEHEQALGLYHRMLHLNRINQGFYHPSHLPIVEKIIESNAALKDWGQLNESYDYLYWLYQRAHEGDGDKLKEGVARLFGWKLAYLPLINRADRSRQLLELEQIADQQLDLLREEHGEASSALLPALYQRAVLHYAHAVALDENESTGRELLEDEAPHLRHREAALQSHSILGVAQQSSLLTNEEIAPLIRKQLYQGRKLVEQMVVIARSMDESQEGWEARAMTRLYLADWDMLMDRRSAALDGYRRSYRQFEKAGVASEDLATFFGRPVAIPRESYLTEIPAAAKKIVGAATEDADVIQLEDFTGWTKALPGLGFPRTAAPGYLTLAEQNAVELEFKVTLDGKDFKTRDPRFVTFHEGEGNIDDVKIVDDEELGDIARRRAREIAEQLIFRPRLVDGEPAATERAQMRFILPVDA